MFFGKGEVEEGWRWFVGWGEGEEGWRCFVGWGEGEEGWRCFDGWGMRRRVVVHMIGWHYLTFYEPW